MQNVVSHVKQSIGLLQVDDTGAVVGLLTRESIAEAMAEAVDAPNATLDQSSNELASERKRELFASQEW